MWTQLDPNRHIVDVQDRRASCIDHAEDWIGGDWRALKRRGWSVVRCGVTIEKA